MKQKTVEYLISQHITFHKGMYGFCEGFVYMYALGPKVSYFLPRVAVKEM